MIRKVAFVLTLFACSSLYSSYYVLGSIPVGGESKYYDRIEAHLSKHVANSDDVEANYKELKRWYEGKHSIFTSGSTLWPVAEQALKMKEASQDCSDRGFHTLELNDKGLANSLRVTKDNYPLSGLDRMVQHFFMEYATTCGANVVGQLWNPRANFGWRRKAFKKLNELVRSSRVHGDTMAKVKDLLEKLKTEEPNGALTDVARSLVELESVIGEDKCTYKAYKMLMRTEVGVKDFEDRPGLAHELRYLIDYFIGRQKQLCDDVWPEMYKAKVKELDEKTLRSLAIMVSEFYFYHYTKSRPHVVEGIEHSKYPQINDDLSTPEVIELVKRVGEAQRWVPEEGAEDRPYLFDLIHPFNMTYADALPLDLRLFVPESHPDYITFTSGKYTDLYDVVPRIFKEFAIEPCEKFLASAKDVLVPSMHFFGGSVVSRVKLDQVEERLGHILGQSLLDICDSALYFKDVNNDDKNKEKDLKILVALADRFK